MKIDPLLPHIGHSSIPEPLFGQSTLNDTVSGHPPVALSASRSEFDVVFRYAEGQQMPSPCARTLPVFPVAEPHAAAQPLVQLKQLRIASTMTEVVQPTDHVTTEGEQTRAHALPVMSIRDLPDALLERTHGGVRPMQLAPMHAKTEEGTLTKTCGLALGFVDDQGQTALDTLSAIHWCSSP